MKAASLKQTVVYRLFWDSWRTAAGPIAGTRRECNTPRCEARTYRNALRSLSRDKTSAAGGSCTEGVRAPEIAFSRQAGPVGVPIIRPLRAVRGGKATIRELQGIAEMHASLTRDGADATGTASPRMSCLCRRLSMSEWAHRRRGQLASVTSVRLLLHVGVARMSSCNPQRPRQRPRQQPRRQTAQRLCRFAMSSCPSRQCRTIGRAASRPGSHLHTRCAPTRIPRATRFSPAAFHSSPRDSGVSRAAPPFSPPCGVGFGLRPLWWSR